MTLTWGKWELIASDVNACEEKYPGKGISDSGSKRKNGDPYIILLGEQPKIKHNQIWVESMSTVLEKKMCLESKLSTQCNQIMLRIWYL